jgi:delta24-sterol reductase
MRPNPHTATLSLSIAIRGYTHATLHNAIEFEEKNMLIEHAVHRLGGFKWLYSRNYYTEDEFWNLYSRTEYEELRKKYGAEYLEDVFRKSMIREEGVKRGRRKAKVKGLWAKVFERTSVVAFQEEEEGEGGDGDVK